MTQDILITPKSGEPQIKFNSSGPVSPVNLNVISGASPVPSIAAAGSGVTSVVFDGTQGRLLEINDNLSSGTIFHVSDSAGFPFFEINASGDVKLAEYGRDVLSSGLVVVATGMEIQRNTPSVTTDKLYNIGGNLYFNGTAVGAGSATITGSGTANYVPRFSGVTSIATGLIFDNGTSVGIKNSSPSASYTLDVGGKTRIAASSTAAFSVGNSSQNVLEIGTATNTAKLGILNDNNTSANYITVKSFGGNAGDVFIVTSSGDVGINNKDPEGQLHVVNNLSTDVGLIVEGAASQSEDLQQWQNNAGNVLTSITSDGSIVVSGDITTSSGQVFLPGGGGTSAPTLVFTGSSNKRVGFYEKISDQQISFTAGGRNRIIMGDDRLQVNNAAYIGWSSSSVGEAEDGSDLRFIRVGSGVVQLNGKSNQPAKLMASGVAVSGVELLSHVPASTTNKLYNDGGTLKFNGSAVGGGGGISFSGSTANGLVTFGDSSTANVESNLTFDGSSLNVSGLVIASTGITLQRNTPATTTDKLYNVGGGLYFNGSGYPTTTYVNTVSGTLQTGINSLNTATGLLNADVSALETATGLLNTKTTALSGVVYNGNPSGVAVFGDDGVLTSGDGFTYASATRGITLDGSTSSAVSDCDGITMTTNGGDHEVFVEGNIQKIKSYNRTKILVQSTEVFDSKSSVGGEIANAVPHFNRGFTAYPLAAAYQGVVIKGVSAQSANLQEWQNSAGTVLASVAPDGSITNSGNISTSGNLQVRGNIIGTDATDVPITVQAAASQSANLQQWQNSSENTLSHIDTNGIYTNIVGTTGTDILRLRYGDATSDHDGSLGIEVTGLWLDYQDGSEYATPINSNSLIIGTWYDTARTIESRIKISANAFNLRLANSSKIDCQGSTTKFNTDVTPWTSSSTVNLGSESVPWTNVYASGATVSGVELSNHVPSVTTNKLYNDGGTLKFNGSTVGGVNGSPSGVAFFGSNGALTANSGSLSFNSGTNSLIIKNGDLSVTPASSTTVPIAVQAAASQSANMAEFKRSDGNVLTSIAADGSIATSGNISSTGDITGNGGATIAGSLGIGTGNHGSYKVNVNTTSADHTFVINDSNGRVGINTETLSSDLNIGGARQLKFTGGNSFIDCDSGSSMYLRAGGNTFIQSDGAGIRFFGFDGGAQLNMRTAATGRRTLVIEKLTSQTADLLNVRDENDDPYFVIDADGNVDATGLVTAHSGIALDRITPVSTTDKLYNVGGSLYFNGSAVGGSGSSYTAGSGLTLDGTEFNIFGGTGNFRQIDVTSTTKVTPKIVFTGSGVNDTPINLEVLSSFASASTSGTALSFEGTQGQLFSITDNLSSGTIFSVNDITGLSLIDVDASGDVSIGKNARYVSIGTGVADFDFEVFASGKFHHGVTLENKTPSTTTDTLYNDGASVAPVKYNGSGIPFTDPETSASGVKNMMVMTEAVYTALSSKDANTLYFLV